MHLFLWVMCGTGFVFLMTCLGAGTVLLFRKPPRENTQRVFLGFAAGVMIAASVWGLLIPAIEEAQNSGLIAWVPAAIGFSVGILFMLSLDKLIPHLHPKSGLREGVSAPAKRTTLLLFAVTLHNVPEGMAVGLSFALAAQHSDSSLYASALALALGIGIQNFPEGSAIALPLRQEGMPRKKAFLYGCLSGTVEPVFGLLTAALAGAMIPLMPWLLAFAAGAMMYVVVEDLIPEARIDRHSHLGTLAVMGGFVLMMILDVALG